MKTTEPKVWIFNGAMSRFPSGAFSTREKAEHWIEAHRLTGTLTCYPLDVGVYDWAVEQELFKVKRPEHSEPEFIQSFSSAAQEHFHYEEGIRTG